MTELAIRDTAGSNGHAPAERDVVDGWLTMASDVIKLANVIAPTEFVPEAYRDNPPAVAAAILTGRELHIGPLTSLRHVQMVKGTPTLSAEYKRARVLAAGHEFDVLELNTTRCRVSGRRHGSSKPPLEITFTMDDARKAGLIRDRGPWQTRPRRMLFARAGSELCDFLFADVVNGLPTTEVMADGAESDELPDQNGTAVAQGEPEPERKPRTAQRKPRDRKPAHVDQGEQGINLPPDQQSYTGPPDQPPLPGEDEDTPPPGPDQATAAQTGLIVRHFARLGFTEGERDQRLALTSRLAGRLDTIKTTRDLSHDQARAVADTLARCRDREKLIALLAEENGDG